MTLRSSRPTMLISSNCRCPPTSQWWRNVQQQRLPAATWWSSSSTSRRGGIQCRLGCFDEHVGQSFAAQRRALHVTMSSDLLRHLRSTLASDRRHSVEGGRRAPLSRGRAGVSSVNRAEVRLCSNEDDRDRGRAVGLELRKPVIDDTGQRCSTDDWEADDDDVSTWICDETHPIKLRLYIPQPHDRNQLQCLAYLHVSRL